MKEVVYSSIMTHIEKTINDREISKLHKPFYEIAPNLDNMDEFDLMIIDKLVNKFNFGRLDGRHQIYFSKFVSDFFPSPGYLEYAFVLKRILHISNLTMTNGVNADGRYRSYNIDNLKKYIEDGPKIFDNIFVFSTIIDSFEFQLIDNDVILTLGINMNHVDLLEYIYIHQTFS